MTANRVLLVALCCLNLFLVYRLFISDQGLFAYLELKERYAAIETRLAEVDQRNLELSQEIRQLKDDKTALEKFLRQQMNFVKEGEIMYVFPEGEAAPPLAEETPETDDNAGASNATNH